MTSLHEPHPQHAKTNQEFVAEMRLLKAWSGLTYRQIESRARSIGAVLPHTTLVEALHRDRLPREDLLAAFVRACGASAEATEEWVAARKTLAIACVRETQPTAEDAPAAHHVGKPASAPASFARFAAAAGIAAVVLLAVDGAAPRHRVEQKPAPSPLAIAPAVPLVPPVVSGAYRIRVANSGLCLSERPSDVSGRVYQTACQRAFPVRGLQIQRDRTYRITTDHPEFGPGCMGIPGRQKTPGPVVYDHYCRSSGEDASSDRFGLEPVTSPLRGFRLRPLHNDLCLGFRHDTTADLATLEQVACDSRSPGQIFLFDRLKGPAGVR